MLRSIIHRVYQAKRAYRLCAWLSAVATTLGVPLTGYLASFVQLGNRNRGLMEDNPELASSSTMPNPWEWLTGAGGMLGRVMLGVAILGVVLLAVCLAAYVLGRVFEETRVEDAANTADDTGRAERPSRDDGEYGYID